MLSPLYVGVVDSPVVKVVAESGDHQSQDLHITQMVLTGGGRVDELRRKGGREKNRTQTASTSRQLVRRRTQSNRKRASELRDPSHTVGSVGT